MKTVTAILSIASFIVGCSAQEQAETGQRAGFMAAPAVSRVASNEKTFLAYEHSVSVEVDESKLKAVHEALIEGCRTDKEADCTVLDASITSTQYWSARLRVRASPAGVKKLLGVASSSGRVLSQSTQVEDLARPVADVEKRLAMLRDYQAKLLELQARSAKDVDSLIKIAERLASVQADLEQASGENAHLTSRIKRELLNVSLSARGSVSFWTPIENALREFPRNLSSGVSTAVVAAAYALPWLVVFVVGIFILRMVWKRSRRR